MIASSCFPCVEFLELGIPNRSLELEPPAVVIQTLYWVRRAGAAVLKHSRENVQRCLPQALC
jgi:hypothetical protein